MSSPGMIFAFGLVILCQISAILSADFVPVLIFGGKNDGSPTAVNPLMKTSSNEFAEIVANKVGGSRSAIVVFEKANFCVEELSQQKLDLSTLGGSEYLPAVESPSDILNNLPFYNTSTEEKPEEIKDGQLITVPIQDLNNVVEDYKNLLATNPNVVAIITGSSCGYSRSERTRRAITTRADAEEVLIYVDRILFYSSEGIYLKPAGADDFTLLGTPTSSSSVANGTEFSLELVYGSTTATASPITLRLQFSVQSAGYWYFKNVEYDANSTTQTLTSDSTIYFPFNFSYHCSLNSVFYTNNIYLNFTDIQVQIDPTVTDTSVVFSDGYDCVGFTSIPIWSGIFITFLLGLIMIWALTMILDIRTMDRFDDPKGKTITITGTD